MATQGIPVDMELKKVISVFLCVNKKMGERETRRKVPSTASRRYRNSEFRVPSTFYLW